MTYHRYRAFGLVFGSPAPIPSLDASVDRTDDAVDVALCDGPVALPDDMAEVLGMHARAIGDTCFLRIDGVGSFEIVAGRRIVVDRAPDATIEQVHLFLLGSVFGVVLHQRRILPMHCNAVTLDGRAFLFCGDSGAGKSTLAAYFQERGHTLLTDDVCALDRTPAGVLMALPGIARLKLWRESLDALGRSADGLRALPWMDDKFELALVNARPAAPAPVAAIYHLRDASEGRAPGIHRLAGLAAANSVTANIYRRRIADLLGGAPAYLAASVRIAQTVPVFSVNRQWGFDHFRSEAADAEQHMRSIA